MQRVPAPVGNLPAPEVVALLSPFMYPTPHAIANNMLFLYIKYHLVLGIKRYVQYTQVRPALPSRIIHPASYNAESLSRVHLCRIGCQSMSCPSARGWVWAIKQLVVGLCASCMSSVNLCCITFLL